jgi:ParB-like chromosome segregation protein Spo0J
MVLAEVANANPHRPLDISFEQERAADLVAESRLYRQTALRTGDAAVAGLLDDLDRVMLDITHSPARLTPAELERLRDRLDSEGILFKIRVLGANVRAEQAAAARASGAERKS